MRISPEARLQGLLLGWAGLGVVCVAVPSLLWLLPLALAAILGATLADLLLLGRAPALDVERQLPGRLSVGREAELGLNVANPGGRAVSAEVFDEIPRDLEALDFEGSDPHYARVAIPARGSAQLRYRVIPHSRGDRELGAAVALARSPLGLLRRASIAGRGQTLSVYPDTNRFLRPEALDPRKVVAALGVKPARRRGEGTEFESLRDYVVGDDPRNIDWPATARRARLVTRHCQQERNHTLLVAVDSSRLMGARFEAGGRTKLDCAIDGALALVYTALVSGDRAGLVVFDREPHTALAPRARCAELGLFVEHLRDVQSRLVEADYRALTRHLLTERQKRSLVVILTDLGEADPSVLITPLTVLARHHRVLLVALRDHAFDLLDARVETGSPEPAGERALYRRIVLDDLLREREATLTRLRRAGLRTLDLVAEDVTSSVLNRYISLRDA